MQNNPYWLKTGNLPNPDWLMSLPDKADIVIIGAGYAGLSTALALAINGLESIVLDSSVPCLKSGPRGDGISFSVPIRKSTLFSKALPITIENNKLFKEFIEITDGVEKVEYRTYGGLHIAKNEEAAERLKTEVSSALQDLGVDNTWLPSNSVRKTSGIRYTDGALFVASDILFNPVMLGTHLVNTNRNLLNKVISGFEFAHIVENEQGKYLITDKLGNVIEAEIVVFCINSYAIFNQILPLKVGTPIRAQYITSNKIGDNISNIPPYALTIGEEYIARTHNKRILFGGSNRELLSIKKEVGIMADAKVCKEIAHSLSGVMSYYFPEIDKSTIGPEHVWTSNVYETPDGLPVVGKIPGFKNAYMNTGYGVDGMSYIMSAGKIVAELILDYREEEIEGGETLSPNRFIKGQNATV